MCVCRCWHLGMCFSMCPCFIFGQRLLGRLALVGLKRESENRLNDNCANTCLKRCITLSHLSLVHSEKDDWIVQSDQILPSVPPSLPQHLLTNESQTHRTGHETLRAHNTHNRFVCKYALVSVRRGSRCCEL